MAATTSTATALPTAASAQQEFTSVFVPNITGTHTTEAFRVSDIKQSSNQFVQLLTDMLANVQIDPAILDVADLKLKTEEQEMQELLLQQQSTPPVVEESQELPSTVAATEEDVEMADAANGGGETQTVNSTEHADEDQEIEEEQEEHDGTATQPAIQKDIDKAAAQKAYDELAEKVKESRRQRRQAAAQKLNVLKAVDEQPEPKAPALFGSAPYEPRNRQLSRLRDAVAISTEGKPLVPEDEVVLQVAIHVPHAPAYVSEEFIVLGSQPLTALRDAIYCLSDVNLKAVNDQENAHRSTVGMPLVHLSKPSAYFFIEGTFYIDSRDPAAIDYSAPIRAYLAEHNITAPPHPPPSHPGQQRRNRQHVTDYSVTNMQDTKFEDLWLRLGPGAPALYCHQGGCEHLVVFKDVRRYVPHADPPTIEQYPFKLSSSYFLSQYRDCEACCSRVAKKVTYNDLQAPHTPFFWCDECYKMAHYDSQGRVLDNSFLVFPYNHEYNLLIRKGRDGGGKPEANKNGEQPEATQTATETAAE